MKFFIDTANLEQIRRAHSLGVLDGVTTNPSLMAKGTSGARRPASAITSKSAASWTATSAPR